MRRSPNLGGPPIPWVPLRPPYDPSDESCDDRLGVFIPAVMSVGLLFSAVTLLRDAFRWLGGAALTRRAAVNSSATVGWLIGDGDTRSEEMGMLPRMSYLVSAVLFVTGSLYVAIGSTANFLRDGGYVHDIGWLLGLSLGLSVALVFFGAVALSIYWTWPDPPVWTRRGLRAGPFTSTYLRSGERGPSWAVTTGIVTVAVLTGLVALMVGTGRGVAMEIDQPIATWLAEVDGLDRLRLIDPFGATWLAVVLAAFVGVAAFRCRVMAWVYPAAVAVGLVITGFFREIVERPRPSGGGVGESFPSGHMVQAVLIAGLVPLAGWVLTSDHRTALVTRFGLTLGVAITAIHRIHILSHWPLDLVAGLGLGVTIVLGAHWALEHGRWHGRCRSCPWSADPAQPIWSNHLIWLTHRQATVTGWVGGVAAIVGAGSLLIATVAVGVPSDPEGYGFSSQVSGPIQISLAVVVLLAGLAAPRWRLPAAVAMAFAGTALGVYAAVQYRPLIAFGLASLLLVPAIVTWVAWQKDETIGRITALAVVTGVLLTMTWIAATEVHAGFFGPTHPESTLAAFDLELAQWVWVGNVSSDRATLVAGGLPDESSVDVWLVGPGLERSATVPTGEDGIVRHTWEGLTPSTRYRYAIEERGEQPDSFDGRFATFAEGPQELKVVVGSCARTASNGSVFDAMRAEDPDLYIGVGDLHYSNLASSDPRDHINEYHRLLIQPAQARLFRSTPFAYVWDDHDFGPNDADSTSPSRLAVSKAYRSAVPHSGVDPDPEASIAQAFSIGRVRFVLSDTRSMRTEQSMLGPDQLRWLIDELTESSQTHALVVWVNPTPWVSDEGAGADDWSAYPDERRSIADALAAVSVDNLVMISGDAHMVAIDNGSNTDYSSGGDGGFPLLHAAALDRPGSVKGGPYSEGAFPGSGQYGLLDVHDDGASITVTLSGKTWDGEVLVEYEFVPVVGSP